MAAILTDLRSSRELLINLTLREVRGKYKRTVLGQGWSLLNPVAQLLVFSLVFGVVIKIKVGPGDPSGLRVFALWLVAGLLPWTYLSNAMTGGMSALLANANLIKKVFFPRSTLVLATVLAWNVSFAFELLVLVGVLTIFGSHALLFLPVLLVFVALLTAFALGLAFALAVANVYFRDTQHFIAIALQVWFYATPIVYPYSLIQGHGSGLIETLYRLNPMERFVTAFRNIMYDGRFPAAGDSLFCLAVALFTLLAGYRVFRRYEGRLAEEL